jgi:hypothetical protein
MTIRSLHRASALAVGLYAGVHVANHLAGLAGVALHLRFMEGARLVYRQPVVEALLLACVAFQVVSGLALVVRGWRQRTGAVAWLQAAAGLYLAFFLALHVAAVLYGRMVLKLDTNFFYAAAGLHVAPFQWFFAPYYFFAVTALFVHLACAALRRRTHMRNAGAVLAVPVVAGAVVAALLVLLLAGRWSPLQLPAEYTATFTGAPR